MDSNKKWNLKPPDYRKLKKWKDLKKDHLIILLLFGILLLVIQFPSGKEMDKKKTSSDFTNVEGQQGMREEEIYAKKLEEHLETLFSHMEGAGKVEVMITLASSTEKVVEKDINGESETVTEEDSKGGNRITNHAVSEEATVYEGTEQNPESPYVSKELTPRVEGVVVLAAGGDNAVVKKNITEAAQALFGIDTHKIRIIKMSEN